MLYLIAPLLDEQDSKKLRRQLMLNSNWKDGMNSATYRDTKTKKNIQLSAYNEQDGEQVVKTALINNKKIMRYTFIKNIHALMFTRTGEGMFYKAHVDNPVIRTGRRDLSFTLFLNDPSSYEGGELVLKIEPETKIVKLKPGEIFIYPTKYLHEVKEVTKGERLVAVGWIESDIPEEENRYILGLIDNLRAKLQRDSELSEGNRDDLHKIQIAYNMLYKRFSG